MDGNKEVIAHMPYADVVALGPLPSVAPFGCAQGGLYPPPRRRTEYHNMLLPQSDKSMKSTLPPTFGTIIIFSVFSLSSSKTGKKIKKVYIFMVDISMINM